MITRNMNDMYVLNYQTASINGTISFEQPDAIKGRFISVLDND